METKKYMRVGSCETDHGDHVLKLERECFGQDGTAERLLYELDWQSPSVLLDEWLDTSEAAICGKCGRSMYFY